MAPVKWANWDGPVVAAWKISYIGDAATSDGDAGEWEDCDVIASLDVPADAPSPDGPARPPAPLAVVARTGDDRAAAAALARACDAPAAGAAEVVSMCALAVGPTTKAPVSKYRGVIPTRAKKDDGKMLPWRAAVYVDGKRKVLDGAYGTEEEAARAYDAEIRRLGRQERSCNFPLIDELPLPGPDNRVSRFRGVHLKILHKRKRKGGAGAEPEEEEGANASKGMHYTASIRVANRSKHLGTFESEEQAALAYDCAAREVGRDAQDLNFPHVTDYSRIRRKNTSVALPTGAGAHVERDAGDVRGAACDAEMNAAAHAAEELDD